ncbi:MAG: hypothetical protein KC443_14415 [Anaerolineales bacterium]|nr:hypothetical protein [Anaerolineales bacterium]
MPDEQDSRVRLHPDGYIEMTFFGLQSADRLQELITEAKRLASLQEVPVNLLIDARNGRVGRDARSFSLMLGVGWVKNLRSVIILVSDDPQNTVGAKESGVIVSVLTAALRLQPTYIYNETDARAVAAAAQSS